MNLRTTVALLVALLLHGLLLALAPSKTAAEQLPPGAGQGIEQEQLASAAAALPATTSLPEVHLALALAPASGQPAAATTAEGYGGGDSYLGVVRAYLNARAREIKGTLGPPWRSAGGLPQRGVSEVRFEIAADGTTRSVQLSLSSGVRALDQAAVALVQRSSPLPPPPQAMRLRVPIEFR